MKKQNERPVKGNRSKAKAVRLVPIKPAVGPLDLGPNVAVKFNMWKFINMLFVQTLNVGAYFKGPGPLKMTWGFEMLGEAVGHNDDYSIYDAEYQRLYSIQYLAEEILRKFDDGKPNPAKQLNARRRFEKAEEQCRLANERFAHARASVPLWANPRKRTDYLDPVSGSVFSQKCLLAARTARKRLHEHLKYESDLVDRHLYFAGHGPGATTRLARPEAHQVNKWGGLPHVTANASTFVDRFLELNPGYKAAGGGYFIFPGNLVDWVPKNFETDRTIAKEPEWNMLYQRCIAHYERERLRFWGVDLRDQSVNQLAAKEAIPKQLVTVDLAMASDTAARNVCMFYFPAWFFDHLDAARSPAGYILDKGRVPTFRPDGLGGFCLANGEEIRYEKISSMGNGNTFETESLLFKALADACCHVEGVPETSVSVYGDDVVLPVEVYPLFKEVLEFSGFGVNDDKTHVSGPFRESCGGHYWCGTDVTPFYVREDVDHLDRLFLLHNNLWRWLQRNPGICDKQKARELLAWVRSHAPEEWRRPRLHNSNVGDGAFIGKPTFGLSTKQFWDMSRELCSTRRYQGWEGLGVNVLTFMSKGDAGMDDHTHEDPKSVFAALWNGLRYETTTGGVHAQSHDELSATYSEVPWHYRYWSIGVQVYPKGEETSWF